MISCKNMKDPVFLKALFVACFVCTVLFQGFSLHKLDIVDKMMWSKQATYVVAHDPQQFDFLKAYGHPGGPIIESVILLRHLPHMEDGNDVLACLLLLNGIAVAATCALCYLLRKDLFWSASALGSMSLNWLFLYVTPPSYVASEYVVLLCVLTLYMVQESRYSLRMLIGWAALSGFVVAVRADIGIVISAMCLCFFCARVGIRKSSALVAGAVAFFALFDPFMWFMPLQHVRDLLHKVVFHYADIAPSRLGFVSVAAISALAALSIVFAAISIFLRKTIAPPVRPALLIGLFGVTALLYSVFLTSHFQAQRYFVPIILVWEVLLPVFIFALIDAGNGTFVGTGKRQRSLCKLLFVVLIWSFHISQLGQTLFIYYGYHLLN